MYHLHLTAECFYAYLSCGLITLNKFLKYSYIGHTWNVFLLLSRTLPTFSTISWTLVARFFISSFIKLFHFPVSQVSYQFGCRQVCKFDSLENTCTFLGDVFHMKAHRILCSLDKLHWCVSWNSSSLGVYRNHSGCAYRGAFIFSLIYLNQ